MVNGHDQTTRKLAVGCENLYKGCIVPEKGYLHDFVNSETTRIDWILLYDPITIQAYRATDDMYTPVKLTKKSDAGPSKPVR